MGGVGCVALLCACPQLLDDRFVAAGIGGSPLGGASGLGSSSDPDGGGGSVTGSAGGGSGGTSSSSADAGPQATAGTGGRESTSTPIVWDGVSEAAPCRFAPPELLSGLELGTGSERGATLDPDSDTLLLSSNRSGNEDLFEATRSGRGAAFFGLAALSVLNTAYDETTPFLAATDLALYFSSNRSGGAGGRDLYVSARLLSVASFLSASRVSNVNSVDDDTSPRLTSDELSLLFSSTRPGGPGGADLWVATRSLALLGFGAPGLLPGVNSAADEDSGHLSADQLAVVFDSTREGGLGGHDLWLATRASTDASFGSPVNLTGLNSSADEVNVTMSDDGQEIFFSSNRLDSSTYRLWRALRSCG